MAVTNGQQAQTVAARTRRERRVLQVVGAVAALLLVTGLIVRASVGLQHPPDERIVTVDPRSGAVTSGGVALRSNLRAPLFDDVVLAPGDVVTECIAIDYRGDVLVDDVLLQLAQTAGSRELMGALDVTVERGVAGRAGCDGFTPQARIASASLAQLAAGGDRPASAGRQRWTPTDGERATYRFTVALGDGAAEVVEGERVTTDFRWIATAVPVGGDLGSRLGMLLLAFARDGIIPLLIMIVVAVLFLGVQDRIDRRDPKLAHAAVSDEPELFIDPVLLTVAGRGAASAGGA